MPSKGEIYKDMAQELTSSAAEHVGNIAHVITGAIRDVANELGDLATDIFEMRDAAKKAEQDSD